MPGRRDGALAGTVEGNVFTLHATKGRSVWNFQTGPAIEANPISFGLDSHQYVAISADRIRFVFSLE
jgi:hypothetical protein